MSACDRRLMAVMMGLGWTRGQFQRAHYRRNFTGFSYAKLCEAEYYGVGEF